MIHPPVNQSFLDQPSRFIPRTEEPSKPLPGLFLPDLSLPKKVMPDLNLSHLNQLHLSLPRLMTLLVKAIERRGEIDRIIITL